ncbi:hypothetical protein [Simkania sp.]|uniref:hypothetical protein n=1 Tax=Simkania sp. TaxID=34094 RepID=UPI003B527816
MTQIVSNFIKTNSYSTLAASSFCAITAMEIAFNAIKDFQRELSEPKDPLTKKHSITNLLRATYCAISAANLTQGSAITGAFILLQTTSENNDTYNTVKLLGWITNSVTSPIAETTTKVASQIFPNIHLICWDKPRLAFSFALIIYQLSAHILKGTQFLSTSLMNRVT